MSDVAYGSLRHGAIATALCALAYLYTFPYRLGASRQSASLLAALVFLFALHRWLSRRDHPAALRDAVFFSIALGSPFHAEALRLAEYTPSVAAAFGAFMLLRDVEQGPAAVDARRALAAGLLTAIAVLLTRSALPCSLALGTYGVHALWPRGRPRALHACAAFGLPATLAIGFVALTATSGTPAAGAASALALLTDGGSGLLPRTPVLALAPLGLAVLLRDRTTRPHGACALAAIALTVAASDTTRELTPCVPFAAYAALIALERWADHQPSSAIAAAVGATAAAMVASGLPSVYYPEPPPALTRPLPQLFAVLVAHGYAPANAGALLSVYGTASMLPLLAVALSALALCLRAVSGPRERALLALAAALVALALDLPLWRRPAYEPGAADAVAAITRSWTPTGHDAAARLRAKLIASPAVPQAELERLAEIYAAEGRAREARLARRGQL